MNTAHSSPVPSEDLGANGYMCRDVSQVVRALSNKLFPEFNVAGRLSQTVLGMYVFVTVVFLRVLSILFCRQVFLF